MFGWEFPPFYSGGLGTACYGLTRSLNKQHVAVSFVLPRRLNVDADFVKFVFGDEELSPSTRYVVNSLIQPYSTSESYENSLHYEKGTPNPNPAYGNNLFEEVERYGAIGEKIAHMETFDIIHAHDWLTFKAALAAKKVSGKYLVVHMHATEFDRTGGSNVNQYVYDIERKGMEAADKVIAVSNYTKQKIVDHYGIPAEKVEVVHNSVDFEDYVVEQIHDLKKTNKIVLFLGRLTLQKGPDYFVYTAQKVLEHYPKVMFVVVGSGDMERMIIRKVAELGIADKFIFAGFLRGKDVAKAYQMADLYVLPSVSEPFGITPLESLMNGTPVLMSNQSGVSEVVTHCLKSDFWDTDDMANKIVSVLKYDALQRCLKENGRREVQKMSWDTPAARVIDIYEDLLNGQH